MTTLTIRQKLMTYVADADDTKVKALYTLLQNEIEGGADFALTEHHYQILAEEEAMYLKGEGKSYTRDEANQIARGLRDF